MRSVRDDADQRCAVQRRHGDMHACGAKTVRESERLMFTPVLNAGRREKAANSAKVCLAGATLENTRTRTTRRQRRDASVVVVVGTFGLCDDGETLLYTARREYERIMIYTERVKTKRNKSLYICIYIFFFWGGKRNEIFFLFCLQNYWLLYAFRIVCLFTKIYIYSYNIILYIYILEFSGEIFENHNITLL